LVRQSVSFTTGGTSILKDATVGARVPLSFVIDGSYYFLPGSSSTNAQTSVTLWINVRPAPCPAGTLRGVAYILKTGESLKDCELTVTPCTPGAPGCPGGGGPGGGPGGTPKLCRLDELICVSGGSADGKFSATASCESGIAITFNRYQGFTASGTPPVPARPAEGLPFETLTHTYNQLSTPGGFGPPYHTDDDGDPSTPINADGNHAEPGGYFDTPRQDYIPGVISRYAGSNNYQYVNTTVVHNATTTVTYTKAQLGLTDGQTYSLTLNAPLGSQTIGPWGPFQNINDSGVATVYGPYVVSLPAAEIKLNFKCPKNYPPTLGCSAMSGNFEKIAGGEHGGNFTLTYSVPTTPAPGPTAPISISIPYNGVDGKWTATTEQLIPMTHRDYLNTTVTLDGPSGIPTTYDVPNCPGSSDLTVAPLSGFSATDAANGDIVMSLPAFTYNEAIDWGFTNENGPTLKVEYYYVKPDNTEIPLPGSPLPESLGQLRSSKGSWTRSLPPKVFPFDQLNSGTTSQVKYCVRVTLQDLARELHKPDTTSGGTTFNSVQSQCMFIVRSPYLQVYGADLRADMTFKNGSTCTPAPAGSPIILAMNTEANGNGSGTDLAALASGVIKGMRSRVNTYETSPGLASPFNSRGLEGAPGNRLTFGNGAPTGRYSVGSNCVPDYIGDMSKPLSVKQLPGNPISIASLQEGQYKTENTLPLTVNGATDFGKRVTIIHNGTVKISSNITYPSTFDPSNVPAFMIVARDIEIDPAVTRLDGIFIAQPEAAGPALTKGTIKTCAVSNSDIFDQCGGQAYTGTGNQTLPKANDLVNSKRLIVKGSFIARKVYFQRTYGDTENPDSSNSRNADNNGDLNTTRASEVFDFAPELYLSRPYTDGIINVNETRYDSIIQLPPIF
jgi:hypothetical protein